MSTAVLHLRRLVHSHRCWAAMLLGVALLFKAVVPGGYMTVVSDKTITVELCSSSGAGAMTLHIPVDGQGDDGGGKAQDTQPCAFSGLGAQVLPAADPVLLAAALAFIFLVALQVADLRLPQHGDHLRPPLRGPPVSGLTT